MLAGAPGEPAAGPFVHRSRKEEHALADAGEAALIARLRAGDLEALADLHRQLGGAMSTLARSMLRNRAEADDVVADALVRIARAGPGFRGERGVRTWTLRIVANLCRDRLRRRRFDGGNVDELSPLEHAGLRLEPVAEWDQALDQRVMAKALERAVGQLPAEQREVIVLRFRTGLPIAEMVEVLGIPEGTVKSRLGRALAALRAALRETAT